MSKKCTAQQMLKVIKRSIGRNLDEFLPEENLILAIIGNTISDLNQKNYKLSALSFFNSKSFERYCDLIGLDHLYTKELLVTGGFINNNLKSA